MLCNRLFLFWNIKHKREREFFGTTQLSLINGRTLRKDCFIGKLYNNVYKIAFPFVSSLWSSTTYSIKPKRNCQRFMCFVMRQNFESHENQNCSHTSVRGWHPLIRKKGDCYNSLLWQFSLFIFIGFPGLSAACCNLISMDSGYLYSDWYWLHPLSVLYTYQLSFKIIRMLKSQNSHLLSVILSIQPDNCNCAFVPYTWQNLTPYQCNHNYHNTTISKQRWWQT